MKNESLATALAYHDRTKHRPSRYAASLGYMDWATQPDPFRRYEDAPLIPLVHSELSPPYHLLFEPLSLPSAPLCLESISHLLRYALGLAAWKSHGNSRWALRCNASSGNLQPTEAYLIAPPVDGISTHTTLSHYASKEHGLEILSKYESHQWDDLPQGSLLIALSSVIWREAWKYGERCWRYCQLDAGHAYEAMRISAATLGWKCTPLSIDTFECGKKLGLDDASRYAPYESESLDMLLLLSPDHQSASLTSLPLPPLPPYQRANVLSISHHDWPILPIIDGATQGVYPAMSSNTHRFAPPATRGSTDIILKRRSAQMMDGSSIGEVQFRQLLNASLDTPSSIHIHFALFVHRVEGIEPGLYFYVRNSGDLEELKARLDPAFIWKESGEGLYLLRTGDFRGAAQAMSCNQEIAKEGAFSFGMLCRFSQTLETYGAIGYKNLYHQCGAIGQLLYLEATSLNLSATGIGCFLDDEFHRLLGIKDESFQSLYHFTIGRALVDPRVTTESPY